MPDFLVPLIAYTILGKRRFPAWQSIDNAYGNKSSDPLGDGHQPYKVGLPFQKQWSRLLDQCNLLIPHQSRVNKG